MVLVGSGNDITVHCLVGVHKYGCPNGEKKANLVRKYYAYHEDVGKTGKAQIVQLFPGMFDATTTINVWKYTHLYQLLVQDSNVEVIPPIANSTAQSEACTACKVVFLPPNLLALLIGKEMKPCDAFTTVYQYIQLSSDARVEDCKPILDLLRTGMKLASRGTLPPRVSNKPGVFRQLSKTLIGDMRQKVLYKALPALNAAEAPTPVPSPAPRWKAWHVLAKQSRN